MGGPAKSIFLYGGTTMDGGPPKIKGGPYIPPMEPCIIPNEIWPNVLNKYWTSLRKQNYAVWAAFDTIVTIEVLWLKVSFWKPK